MTSVFTSVRDLHTNYLLPAGYEDAVAVLPFMLEDVWLRGRRRYVITKVAAEAAAVPVGVQVTHWNGVPIERAVESNAAREAGGNDEARHALGLERLTVRPLLLSPPPDEEWIEIQYLDRGRKSFRTQWQVVFAGAVAIPTMDDAGGQGGHLRRGLDLQRRLVGAARRAMFHPTLAGAVTSRGRRGGLNSRMPDAIEARVAHTRRGRYGYVRIWSFDVDDAQEFISEFLRLVARLPQDGLILDVRGNGGGLIPAGEMLLQTLTPRQIEPERFHFINSPTTLEICKSDPELAPWVPSIEQSVETAAVYSQGFPLTTLKEANSVGQRYQGPVVLVTDALCYSATDIFAAGFEDHDIGPILGVDANTGAGGANVWTSVDIHELLSRRDVRLAPLPQLIGFRVAVRQSTRVRRNVGVLLEDLGVRPRYVHRMTMRDVLARNGALIDRAAELLVRQPRARLTARVGDDRRRTVEILTRGVTRIACFLDDQPLATVVAKGRTTTLTVPPKARGSLRLEGYAGHKLVVSARLRLGTRRLPHR
jgi:hypothetical protein